METLGLVSNLDDRREASVRHLSTTPANGGGDGSAPVESGETPGHKGSGFHVSRQIKSTPAADRHRSAAPNGGGDRLLRQMAAALVAAVRRAATLQSTSSTGRTSGFLVGS